MIKFEFSLLTKQGHRVDSIIISGNNQSEAERKLMQMYRYCTITACNAVGEAGNSRNPQITSLEEILNLISK
jgi:hypothetical protein